MAMNNLSIDGEFRYIIQWFNEWSELQRDDFIPVLVEYLKQGGSSEVYMNGILNSVSQTDIQDKPMSLFQCRIKLFREWNKKWPLEFKYKLQEKIIELDSKVGEKITNEIKLNGGEPVDIITNILNGDGTDNTIEVVNDVGVSDAIVTDEIAEPAEGAINLDSEILAALNNETPVDDNNASENADSVTTNATMVSATTTVVVSSLADTQRYTEPAEQVQMQAQIAFEENGAVTDSGDTGTTTAA